MRHMLVISSLLAMLFVGCAGQGGVNLADVEKQAFDDLRSEIRIAINDAERETKAITLVDELSEELESLRSLKTISREQGRRLNANYDTTRAEFDVFISASNVEIRLTQQRILEKRVAFIAITTLEEWNQIFNARTNAISAAIESIQSI
ncbi:MAG: hypothetical protein E2O51_07445 [Gammaproteobacteria bacterium]|nr:MAG: hypothetical protein E2O51_07445 [Gammaproteobacteria bacterium]